LKKADKAMCASFEQLSDKLLIST